MQDYHYIAYQKWPDDEVTIHENPYYSISDIVDDLYDLHDDKRSYKFLKIDPSELEVEDVTQEVTDRLSEKANHNYDHGLLDLDSIHPLIRDEFSNELILEDA